MKITKEEALEYHSQDRRGKIDLLPATRSFVREGRAGEQRAVRAPQITDMRAGILRSLIEADAGDLPGHRGTELDSKLQRIEIAHGNLSRDISRAENCQI